MAEAPEESIVVILPKELEDKAEDFNQAVSEELMSDRNGNICLDLVNRIPIHVAVFSTSEIIDMLSRAFSVINTLAQAEPGDNVLALRPECEVLISRYDALPLTKLFEAGQ